MREKFARFMAGRYGMDTMGRFTIGLALFLVVINYAVSSRIINLLVWVLLILAYYRMFSRNVYKRSSENQVFLNKTYKIRHWFYTEDPVWSEKDTPHLPLSILQTEDPCTKRQGQDRDPLSKV